MQLKVKHQTKMDPIIFENTEKYAKTLVMKKVVKLADRDPSDPALKQKIIYVAEPEVNTESWRAVLIDSQTQAGKTRKCFEILHTKIKEALGNTLVLFVTQANSSASVNQILQRASCSDDILSVIPAENIFRSNNAPDCADVKDDANMMLVDFWNSKNMDNMLTFVQETKECWGTITIVIDEVEQAGMKGVKDRLGFIRNVEKVADESSIINVIFVTATTANLSKCILRVHSDNPAKFRTGVVSEIVSKPVVEHHYAQPHETYVGASWFKETPDVWKRLLFPRRDGDMSKEDYANLKQDMVLKEIKKLDKTSKELSLIVTSTRTQDHSRLAERLYRIGYNVTVELNGTLMKNYKVNYVDQNGAISSWVIPYSQIDALADRGNLETYRNAGKKVVKTHIYQKEDYTLSHILQAALFMMTDAEERIKCHCSEVEFKKLEAISMAMSHLDKKLRRPEDYPDKPRVALVAGHLAGRGITIQNPGIDFTCTSFCFTETRDVSQRGATNTQRFGRACGMLADVFAREGRRPVLIATDGIVRDAVANEMAVVEKAEEFPNGSLISLKDLVTQKDWERMMKRVKEDMKKGRDKKDGKTVEGISITDLKRYYKSNYLVGKMLRYLYAQNTHVSLEDFKDGIAYPGTLGRLTNNLHNGTSVNCQYGKLWVIQNNTVMLNPVIRNIITTEF